MKTNKEELYTPDILQMFDQGMVPKSIASELEVSETLVRHVLKENGRSRLKRSRGMSTEKVEEICNDYTGNMGVAEIIAKHNISYATLYAALVKMEIPLRRYSSSDEEAQKARVDQCLTMYKDGVPLWKITMETGFQQPQIHQLVHKHSIPLRRGALRAKRLQEQQRRDNVEETA